MKLTRCGDNPETEEITINENIHTLFKNERVISNYRLFVNDFAITAHEFDNNLNMLMQATPEDTLEVVISSWGGYTNDLKRLENIFKEYFYGRVTTKLNSFGYSCGGFIFLMGDERIIYENSEIMFHNVVQFFDGKRSDIEENLKYSTKYWNSYISRLLLPYFKQTEIKSLFKGKEIWLDAYEMCKRGIATKILIFGELMNSKDYIKYVEDKEFKDSFNKELIQNLDYLSTQDADYLLTISEYK